LDDLDRGRVLRLKGVIDGQLAVSVGPMSGEALSVAAHSSWTRILDALPPNLRAEFERDFPPEPSVSTQDVVALAQLAKRAEVRLRGMAGWLKGLSDSLD
jgi:hypothetical protein